MRDSRRLIWFGVIVLVCGIAAGNAAAAPASTYFPAPGRIELHLEPVLAFPSVLSFGARNGLQIYAPERGSNTITFGINGGIGVLATPNIEPEMTLELTVLNANSQTITTFGFVPGLKLNLWSTGRVNPFFEPFAGFLLASGPRATDTYFNGGLFTGLELLVGSWGFRLWSGFEAIIGNGTHAFGIPVRWAIVVFF